MAKFITFSDPGNTSFALNVDHIFAIKGKTNDTTTLIDIKGQEWVVKGHLDQIIKEVNS